MCPDNKQIGLFTGPPASGLAMLGHGLAEPGHANAWNQLFGFKYTKWTSLLPK